ncbi:PASTA domain-containing protein [Solirubrobacter sp. CPCC 204708]|uniref:PASTA domain-containing protein n=1 Tax=Solirubrobacter deserti TaxID=2282478 RepID=A0ABT4RBL5_9ACTN|nr:PASTA domain-containing protein [Solirubrobacter deserti]MBE2317174.1 PASTA domain-containing protein [Solirubrobacter deserti]MDA0135933.1 PASTA domain-containing protein [Solirubrobacter deserti]
MGIRFRACAVALAIGGLAGCGESSADRERIAELEARVDAAESQAATSSAEAGTSVDTETDAAAEEVTDEVIEEEPAEAQASGDGDCIRVPNVVGKDHQLAQDTMQAAGLYYLDERDATGQGRMLMLDRNWTTVKQRPKAGKCVPEDTEILLSAVKDGER